MDNVATPVIESKSIGIESKSIEVDRSRSKSNRSRIEVDCNRIEVDWNRIEVDRSKFDSLRSYLRNRILTNCRQPAHYFHDVAHCFNMPELVLTSALPPLARTESPPRRDTNITREAPGAPQRPTRLRRRRTNDDNNALSSCRRCLDDVLEP